MSIHDYHTEIRLYIPPLSQMLYEGARGSSMVNHGAVAVDMHFVGLQKTMRS